VPSNNPLIIAALAAVTLGSTTAAAQDDADLLSQAEAAARGVFDLCRQDQPDAAKVIEHGDVWGWPRFVGWIEHPEGYQREAGGESRRTFQVGDSAAFVEAAIQSGVVTSAAPAVVRYFRCNIASDQPVDADLAAYFTHAYGPPVSTTDKATVWLLGAAEGRAPDADDSALAAVKSAGPGAQAVRIELTRERGLDRAKLTMFVAEAASRAGAASSPATP
jgi:hypothetical protein